jgi:hypothetical protein
MEVCIPFLSVEVVLQILTLLAASTWINMTDLINVHTPNALSFKALLTRVDFFGTNARFIRNTVVCAYL